MALTERLDYLLAADLRVVMVGPTEGPDNLAKWLIGRNVLRLRADVCIEHLSIYRALDLALGNPDPMPEVEAAELDAFLRRVETFPEELLARVRSADNDVQTAEYIEEAARDDQASVRHADLDDQAMPAVAVLSSTEGCVGTMQAAIDAARDLMVGNVDPGNVADADADAPAPEQEAQRRAIHPTQVPDGMTPCARGAIPCSEFMDNGLHLARLFRHVMPLVRTVRHMEEDGAFTVQSWPLTANSSLTVEQMRHLLTQFTNRPAQCQPLICVLGNQMQRFSTIRSVGAAARTASFTKLIDVLGEENFWEELSEVCELMRHPKTENDVKVLAMQKKLLPMFRYAGQHKPWGRQARGSFKAKILGMSERHSLPSVFVTASLDDAHQMLSIRLSFPSYSNKAFPGFADAMHHREGSAAHDHAQTAEEDRVMELLRALREHEGYAVPSRDSLDINVHFDEAKFQALVADNPVATSLMYEVFTDALVEVLIGLPYEKQRRKTNAMLDCLDEHQPSRVRMAAAARVATGARRHSSRLQGQNVQYGADDSRRQQKRGEKLRTERQRRAVQAKGIFGLVPAWVAVTETSAREALHWHAALVTALSPRLVAMMAARPEFRARLLRAIESHVRAHVPWEVHAVHAARQELLPRGAPRVSFQPMLTRITEDPAEQQQVHFRAKQMGNHGCGLRARGTCGKKPSGEHHCRFNKPSGHDVEETYIAQAVTFEEDGATHDGVLDEDGQFRGVLLGGTGRPPLCDQGCDTYWPGENRAQPTQLDVRLYEPQPWEEPLVSVDGREPILPRDHYAHSICTVQ